MGITPPPAFEIAEDVWGYRSLEKTVQNLQGIVSSRDFGLRFDGPVTGDGTVRYAVMMANNRTVGPEADKYKRVYGQLAVRPTEQITLVVGADHAGYDDGRDHGTRVSAFGGYATEHFRVGAEGYWYRVAMKEGDARTDVGASIYGTVQVAPQWEVVARLDRSAEFFAGDDRYGTSVLGGVAYTPNPNVAPNLNLGVQVPSEQATSTTARFPACVRADKQKHTAGHLHRTHAESEKLGSGEADLGEAARPPDGRKQKFLQALGHEDDADHEADEGQGTQGPAGLRGGKGHGPSTMSWRRT
jgi:hypothetical protein